MNGGLEKPCGAMHILATGGGAKAALCTRKEGHEGEHYDASNAHVWKDDEPQAFAGDDNGLHAAEAARRGAAARPGAADKSAEQTALGSVDAAPQSGDDISRLFAAVATEPMSAAESLALAERCALVRRLDALETLGAAIVTHLLSLGGGPPPVDVFCALALGRPITVRPIPNAGGIGYTFDFEPITETERAAFIAKNVTEKKVSELRSSLVRP